MNGGMNTLTIFNRLQAGPAARRAGGFQMNGTWKADEILLTDADIQNINSQAGKLKWHEDKSQNFRGNWTQMVFKFDNSSYFVSVCFIHDI